MKNLNIKGTCATPYVHLDRDQGFFEIVGRSVAEDALVFYKPVMRWISGYACDPNPVTEFTFRFEYLNVESSRVLLDMIAPLKDIKGLTINWYCQHQAASVREVGEYLSELLSIPFIYKTV